MMMWYPSTVTVAPSVEPVTLTRAKIQCGILPAEDHFDDLIGDLIAAARAHAEKYCNARWATQTIACQCDSFADLARLPEAPVSSVTTIGYVDPDGDDQTVDEEVYKVHADGLEPSIGLAHGQAWPRIDEARIVGWHELGLAKKRRAHPRQRLRRDMPKKIGPPYKLR